MTKAAYGSWPSPISATDVARASVQLSEPSWDGADLYWIEVRPDEGGRNALMRRDARGGVSDVLPPGFNSRTMVHEYGGGNYAVVGGTVWSPSFEDQRLYRQDPGEPPRPITPEGKLRYADLQPDPRRSRILCVREDHRLSDQDCVNQLVAVPAGGEGDATVLASGRDFYSSPRLSPDGSRMAWLEWDHPLMPWDGAELHVAALRPDGSLGEETRVAGGEGESIFQPSWSAQGVLHFVSDRTGWWNLYRAAGDGVAAVLPREAEFGVPQWRFAATTYAILEDGRIVAACTASGFWRLLLIADGRSEELELPFTYFSGPAATGDRLAVLAASPSVAPTLIELDLRDRSHRVVRLSETPPDPAYVSEPEPVEFPSGSGTAHGLLYRPLNPGYEGEGRPPLLVNVHGGPTSAAQAVLNLSILYYTSRGFAVLDLNYRGSTGYGRPYRDELYGRWGVIDVEDAVAAARHLAERGEVDPVRLAVTGGSAGGYTTLAALAFAPGTFRAGVDLFGLSDLRVFDRDTHKFESRYITQLIGGQQNYDQRSPVTQADRIDVPLLVLQGLDDRIVPPNQAEIIVASLERRGVPHAYLAFEGEGHGFRRAENIARGLEAELAFYCHVFDLAPPPDLPSLDLVGS